MSDHVARINRAIRYGHVTWPGYGGTTIHDPQCPGCWGKRELERLAALEAKEPKEGGQ